MSGNDGDDGTTRSEEFADAAALAEGLIAREPGALTTAVRLAGSTRAGERERVRAAIEVWLRRTGKSARVGLAGAEPDAVDAFAARLVARGHRVAVLLVGASAAGAAGERGDRFDGTLPDERAVVAATLACEIGGYDTVLVSAAAATAALRERVDCTVGPADGDTVAGEAVDVSLAPPPLEGPDALDALWSRIERYRWLAVEDGTHAMRREAQRASWSGLATRPSEP